VPDNLKPAAPEKTAPRVVALFLTEYIPGVKKEYALLEQACDGPVKITLPHLQMETLIFALHCLDRAIFAFWGAEYRAVFMDYAFSTACEVLYSAFPEPAKERLAESFERLCATRQREYTALTPLVGKDVDSGNVLAYEFGEKMCFSAGVRNVDVIATMISNAQSILIMMLEIAEDL